MLVCLTVVAYEFLLERGDYLEIYISGLGKPLRIKDKRRTGKVLKIIRKTIRKKR